MLIPIRAARCFVNCVTFMIATMVSILRRYLHRLGFASHLTGGNVAFGSHEVFLGMFPLLRLERRAPKFCSAPGLPEQIF